MIIRVSVVLRRTVCGDFVSIIKCCERINISEIYIDIYTWIYGFPFKMFVKIDLVVSIVVVVFFFSVILRRLNVLFFFKYCR